MSPKTPITTTAVPTIDRHTFDNGLRLLVYPSQAAPHVTVRCVLPAAGGLWDPAGQDGLASITAAAARSGAGERDDAGFADAVERLGARLSSSAGREAAEVGGDVVTLHAENLPRYLDLMTDLLRGPRLETHEIDKIRDRRIDHLRRLPDDHGGLCARAFEQTALAGHPMGRSSVGTLGSLPTLATDHLREFYATHWGPRNAVIGIAGDIETARAIDAIGERLGDWTGPTDLPQLDPGPTPIPEGRQLTLVDPEDSTISQIHFRIGHGARLHIDDDDYPAFRLASYILGGDFTARLNQKLRVEEGLTYGARFSFNVSRRLAGTMAASTYAPLKDASRAVALALAELERITTEPIGAEELDDAQRKLIHAFPFRFETAAGTTDQHIWVAHEGLPQDFLAQFQEALISVTPEAASAAARKHLQPGRCHIVAVGPASLAPELTAMTNMPVDVVSPKTYGCGPPLTMESQEK